MDVIECIKNRRSNRVFTSKKISPHLVQKIIDLALYAPSGKNCRPWKIVFEIDKSQKASISSIITKNTWIRSAPVWFLIYLDKSKSYDLGKDTLACGAVMQNILLLLCEYGLSGCCVGEVTQVKEQINETLNVDGKRYELQIMIAAGEARGLCFKQE